MKNVLFIILVVACISKQSFSQKQGQKYIDSLLNELPKAKEDNNKVKLLNDLSFAYKSIKPDEGLKYGRQALRIAEKLKFKNGIATANEMIGLNYSNISDNSKALEYYDKAWNIFKKQNNKSGIEEIVLFKGIVYRQQGNYAKALEYELKALKTEEEINNKRGIATVDYEIGLVYELLNDFSKSLEYLYKALFTFEKLDDKEGESKALTEIGYVYYRERAYSKSLEYSKRALTIAENLGDKKIIAINFLNLGNYYEDQGDFPKALEYYKKSLEINEELGDKYFIGPAFGNIGEVYFYLAKDTTSARNKTLPDSLRNKITVLHKAIFYLNKSIQIDKEIGHIAALVYFFSDLSQAHALAGNYKEAYESHISYTLFHDSAYSFESNKKIKFLEAEKEKELKQKELEIQKRQILISQYEKYGLLAGLGLMGIIAFITFRSLRRKKRDNLIITRERQRSDELLLNIIPPETANELKLTGSIKAKTYDMVTVMFTDFKNFSRAAEKLSAEELVKEIHYYYSMFDKIISKYNIEKIKTIGDSYMAAGGLPVENKTNSEDTVMAALEIKKFMEQYKQEKQKENKPYFEIRIGIHTGPVVAGIVGIKKFAYDIWGDTVNVASRMESSGEAGKVNISGVTYELIKDKFTCIYRGKIEAKNKGEIDMYFVEEVK